MSATGQDRKAEFLKALGHPARIAILEILRRGEECVCRICPQLDGSQPNTSKHLAVLKKAGILDSRQEGAMTFYWVIDTRAYEILELAGEMVRREERAHMRKAGVNSFAQQYNFEVMSRGDQDVRHD